jgi:hypothetical protein
MEPNNELVRVVTESGLENQTAEMLTSSFLPFFEKAKEWNEKAKALVVTDASQVSEMKMARVARLALREIRIDADKKRKELKEDSLRYGKAVQGVYNVIEYLIAPIEKHLQDQEDFAKIQEEKRKSELAASRQMDLQPYIEFVPYQVDLGSLTDEAWDKLLSGAKLQMAAKIEAERKAEEERIEASRKDSEERERIRLENERLKAAAIERERLATIEREKAEAERKALEEKARKEREEAERVLADERAKAEAELKRIEAAAIERERLATIERDRLAAELKAKQDAEKAEHDRLAKIEADRIAAEKKAAKAPDKDKLTKWVNDSAMVRPSLSTSESIKVATDIEVKFAAFKTWAISQIETL